MTWDVPVKDDCPVCGHTMFKKAGKGFNKPFCANPECPNFLPEDKRGYRRRKTEDAAAAPAEGASVPAAEPAAEEKPAAREACGEKDCGGQENHHQEGDCRENHRKENHHQKDHRRRRRNKWNL